MVTNSSQFNELSFQKISLKHIYEVRTVQHVHGINGQDRKEHLAKSKKEEANKQNAIEPSLTQSSSDQHVDGSDRADRKEEYTILSKSNKGEANEQNSV